MWQILFKFFFQNLTIIFIVCMLSCGVLHHNRFVGGCGGMASLHSFRAGGYKLYSPSTGSTDYRLKSGCSHTHRLKALEIPPIHYVILSSDYLLTYLQFSIIKWAKQHPGQNPIDVLWLTGYVP